MPKLFIAQSLCVIELIASLLVCAVTLSAMWTSFLSYPVVMSLRDKETHLDATHSRAAVAIMRANTIFPVALCARVITDTGIEDSGVGLYGLIGCDVVDDNTVVIHGIYGDMRFTFSTLDARCSFVDCLFKQAAELDFSLELTDSSKANKEVKELERDDSILTDSVVVVGHRGSDVSNEDTEWDLV
ncbi:hypothetical protein C8Q80DRAFT_1275654 [Daedaleopsis nitida]|nr:hypothetical protein C8Q80DRAFT_1275654 [Daedaleopsis nitida]